MQDQAVPFHEAAKKLLDSALSSEELRLKSAGGERGPHFPCIIGHHRQYALVGIFFHTLTSSVWQLPPLGALPYRLAPQ